MGDELSLEERGEKKKKGKEGERRKEKNNDP